MTKALYGRNYDYSPRRYDPTLVAIQPKGHASLACPAVKVARLYETRRSERGVVADVDRIFLNLLSSIAL